MEVVKGRELTVHEVLKRQGKKVVVACEGAKDQVFMVFECSLLDNVGCFSLSRVADSGHHKFYEGIEVR